MNTDYINKYIKYKNKYVKYINQYGGKCSHLITENGLINNDLVTEESYTDIKLICRTVYSLVNDISEGVVLMNEEDVHPTKFPTTPILSRDYKMTIHDIWNIIILNNKVTKELNIKSTQTNLKYIYTFTKVIYSFINECLKILTYNDIYAYADCTIDNISSRTLMKLQNKIINNKEFLNIFSNEHEYKIQSDTTSIFIVEHLLKLIYSILTNKKEYIETIAIDEFDNIVWFGRKIKDNTNYHFINDNLILYICDKISSDLWPQNPIIVYDELSIHIIWTHIITYNKTNHIFRYSKNQYDFIDSCLKSMLQNRITKNDDIKDYIFDSLQIDDIFTNYKDILGEKSRIRSTQRSLCICKKLLSTIKEIVVNSNKYYNTEEHKYNIIACDRQFHIGNIPEYSIPYRDENLYNLYVDDILYFELKNYKNDVIHLSKKIKIIIEFIKYIDIYNIIPILIIDNITKYIELCKVYSTSPDLSKEELVNRDNHLSTFIKQTIKYMDDIKNILDLFTIVIFIIFNNRCLFKDGKNIFLFSYKIIFRNMKKYFNKNKYEVVDLINYTTSNMNILLSIRVSLLSELNLSCSAKLSNISIKNIYEKLENLFFEITTIFPIKSDKSRISYICKYFENNIQKICITNSYSNINNIFNKILEIHPSNFDITLLKKFSIHEIINYLIYNMTQYYIEPHMNYEIMNLLYNLYNKVLIYLNGLYSTIPVEQSIDDLKVRLKQETQEIAKITELTRGVQKIHSVRKALEEREDQAERKEQIKLDREKREYSDLLRNAEYLQKEKEVYQKQIDELSDTIKKLQIDNIQREKDRDKIRKEKEDEQDRKEELLSAAQKKEEGVYLQREEEKRNKAMNEQKDRKVKEAKDRRLLEEDMPGIIERTRRAEKMEQAKKETLADFVQNPNFTQLERQHAQETAEIEAQTKANGIEEMIIRAEELLENLDKRKLHILSMYRTEVYTLDTLITNINKLVRDAQSLSTLTNTQFGSNTDATTKILNNVQLRNSSIDASKISYINSLISKVRLRETELTTLQRDVLAYREEQGRIARERAERAGRYSWAW